MAAPRVFICYRREETAAYAGRLHDAMVARFGEGNVFMDLDLAPGLDFVDRITDAVGACRVLLAVMGPRWATVAHGGEGPRIADPEDYVRLEIETALRHSNVTVIPVLVGGAQMPDGGELPEGIRAITRRNAQELSDARWRYDVGRLVDALDPLVGGVPGDADRRSRARARPTPSSRAPTQRLLLEAVAVGAVSAFLAGLIAAAAFATPKHYASAIAYPILRRTLIWAVVGAALGLWLTARTRGADGWRGAVYGALVGAIAGALGGAIVAVPGHVPKGPNPVVPQGSSGADWLEVGSVAVTGGLIGALIGGLWRPASRGVGFGTGAIAGGLIALIFNLIEWDPTAKDKVPFALAFGVRAAVIAGVVVATVALVAHRAAPPGDAAGVAAGP